MGRSVSGDFNQKKFDTSIAALINTTCDIERFSSIRKRLLGHKVGGILTLRDLKSFCLLKEEGNLCVEKKDRFNGCEVENTFFGILRGRMRSKYIRLSARYIEEKIKIIERLELERKMDRLNLNMGILGIVS